jgi:nitrogenase molybdenum-iron protein NifN
MSDHAKMVNENQCNMCMPMGGMVAFKGVEDSMVIVHGSQGCSTYMRLSNCEHYNEPVDIASSSLNEKQTIYGGEENLRKAIDNVIRVYKPRVIGIVTTCLAETIGEDMDRMVDKYVADHDLKGVDIIPVSTPSYGGSQTEGFWAATRALIAHYAGPCEKHGKINVILPHISTADIREIKRVLETFGLDYTMIPDYSLTLDRPYQPEYRKIAPGGTKTEDISRMSGARATIQFGLSCPDHLSPGLYLQQEFGVPLISLPLPIGLENSDRFTEALKKISGKPLPASLELERGWLLDAMADSHKYNAAGRPVIYGEPELVYAFAGACAENGAFPAVIATGTQNSRLVAHLKMLLAEADELPEIMEGADFASIDEAALEKNANIAIGHSGGKFLTEHRGMHIVRMGFPIHDRVGGQRILSAGYAGTLAFLDRFTNTLLEDKHDSYRQLKKDELKTQEALIEGDE